jgi:DNA helicase-2/ATP-dependent DNA helicase PcrA
MADPKLRPSQEAVVAGYASGRMGVAAVPGSGKTFTLSHLAARLVDRLAESGRIDEQEVLIVTFTNPAVNTFRNRIARLVQHERGLLPYVGYRVRTLHGLAHDIVRMRPGLVGLSEGFDILDERITSGIKRDLAEHWIRNTSDELLPYVEPMHVADADALRSILRQKGAELIESLADEAIRISKDELWDPEDMRTRLTEAVGDLPLARIAINLYSDYQRALSYRGAVDFDDLVRLAMLALRQDREFLARLQARWPYILEDEAQDSSKLQNELLSYLSGERNREQGLSRREVNWVRVGDPNQAIFTTFTTANANFLRRFLARRSVAERPLPVSGRSSPQIIALANRLVEWTVTDTFVRHLSGTFLSLAIQSTEPGDPQPNPANGFMYLDWDLEKNITPEEELKRVVGSLERWLPQHEDWSVAVLAPENSRGFKVAEALKERGIPHEELLRSTSATRDAAARLMAVFSFLADPTSGPELSRVYHDVWWPKKTGNPADEAAQLARSEVTRLLRGLVATEDFVWPGPGGDWLDKQVGALTPEHRELLKAFRQQMQTWLRASDLPADQLVLTLSQDLFSEQPDLALGHKIAVVMGSIAANNPDYRLPELSQELKLIAQNERRFLGFDDAAEGYEPKRGVVTVATMHSAKGLEWDRVYLMAVNNYSFPAALPGDSYLAEKWFIRDSLNLQAETRRQIEAVMGSVDGYVEGEASEQARIEYAMERLRLLYVGITRARRDLVITWNMGRFWEQGPARQNQGAAALIELTRYWKEHLKG